MTSSRVAEESTATMSIRGVITSATVVSASEKTPSSMSRSAGPALRAGCVGMRSRALASAQPARRRRGRSGASVAAAPRRAGRGQLGRHRRHEARQQVADDPHEADRGNQPDEPTHRRAGPPGDRRARGRAGEHQEREMRHVEVAGERAALDLLRRVAAERARQVGVRLRRQREPRRPQRERRRHQRREEELQKRDHASAPT